MAFKLFITALILLRLAELILARKNEQWMRQNGAREFGAAHYPLMVSMHTLFFLSLITEYFLRGPLDPVTALLILYILLVFLKIWVISSLGKFWNTKILRIPGISLISKGPYRYVRHPNYIIVVAEIAVIPLSFHLYYTAILFSLLNAGMLYIRINAENKALNT